MKNTETTINVQDGQGNSQRFDTKVWTPAQKCLDCARFIPKGFFHAIWTCEFGGRMQPQVVQVEEKDPKTGKMANSFRVVCPLFVRACPRRSWAVAYAVATKGMHCGCTIPKMIIRFWTAFKRGFC